ncbi:hypothetical protein PV396_43825 [Streptomyces sp. ME02-8801-2C]|nr:hypothetical protein [Streptomyces sp. ME02-8801-2C]
MPDPRCELRSQKTVVVDNAKIFKAGQFKDACETLGIEVEPARERTAEDKAIIERSNHSIKSGFSQFVAGYTGNRLDRRGKNVEHEPLLSLNELQDLWHEWVVTEWQTARHEGLRSPFLPAMVEHGRNGGTDEHCDHDQQQD